MKNSNEGFTNIDPKTTSKDMTNKKYKDIIPYTPVGFYNFDKLIDVKSYLSNDVKPYIPEDFYDSDKLIDVKSYPSNDIKPYIPVGFYNSDKLIDVKINLLSDVKPYIPVGLYNSDKLIDVKINLPVEVTPNPKENPAKSTESFYQNDNDNKSNLNILSLNKNKKETVFPIEKVIISASSQPSPKSTVRMIPAENAQSLLQCFSNNLKEIDNTAITSEEIASNHYAANPEKINCNSLALQIVAKHHFIYYSGSLYFFQGAIYKRLNDHESKTLMKQLLPKKFVNKLSTYDLKEVINQISTTPSIQRVDTEIDTYEHFICFSNGIYDLKRKKMLPHSHKYYFFSYVDANFTPMDTPLYGSNFEEYLNTCSGGDTNIKTLILEIFGYIISNSMASKKLFLIVGTPDSGKSSFGNLLMHLLGFKNCACVMLQDLSKRFQIAELCGKKLCLNMDLSDDSIKDTALIKQLTGNDLIPAERKYDSPFFFKNQCKLLYACNNIPSISSNDTAKGFLNRLIILPFNYSVPPELQDKNLMRTLLKETNSILNRSIEALEHLRENNYVFTTCSTSEETKRNYIEHINTAIEFFNECCILDNNYRIYSSDLYGSYRNFCNENCYSDDETLTLKQFTTTLFTTFNLKKSKWRDGLVNARGFLGIRLKENF